MKIRDYLQIICHVGHKELLKLAAGHFDDGKYWDTALEYDDNWPTCDNGVYIYASYPAGENMQAVTAAWINPAVPSDNVVFDALRMQRGNFRPLTNDEIDQLRSVCLIGVQQDMDAFIADSGMIKDPLPSVSWS